MCKRFRIDNSKRAKHSALIDCELLAKVYINLLDQREPKLNFNDSLEVKEIENISGNNNYSKKIIYPSEIEIKDHKEFLSKSMKKSFY